MSSLWRRLGARDPTPVAAAGLAVALVLLLGAYGVGLSTVQATTAGVVSALALLAIVGAGLLYAWRPGAGGPVE